MPLINKTYPLAAKHISWIRKNTKAMNLPSDSVFIRYCLDFLMESPGDDFKKVLTRSRLQAMLMEVQSKANGLLKKKEELEQELEKLQ